MKIYIVFEDQFEAHVYSAERLFRGAFLKEEDAKNKVKELSTTYNDIYYEEVEVK